MASRTFDNIYKASTPTATNILDGVTVSLRKKGYIGMINGGVNDSNRPSLSSGNNTLATLPSEMRPSVNIYFPVLYRIPDDVTFYNTYGCIYTNGSMVIYLPTAQTLRQMIFDYTYTCG